MNKALLALVALTCITQAEVKKTYEATYSCSRSDHIVYSPYYKVGRLCVDNVLYNVLYHYGTPHEPFKSYNYKTKEPYYCTETTKVKTGYLNDMCVHTMTTFENVKDIK